MKSTDFDSFRRNALQSAYDRYGEQLAKCRLGFIEESVHDLRVAIRRLLAAVDLFNSIHPLSYLAAIRKDMKRKLRAFNALRDAHVALSIIKANLYRFPILQIYYHELVSREQLLALQLKSEVEKFDDRYVEDALFLLNLYFSAHDSESFTLDEARVALREAKEKFDKRLAVADPSDGATIHKARIAFKRFRYMAEALSIELGITKENKKRMNEYQTLMGEIQDSEALLNDFTAFSKRISKEYRPQINEALKYLKSERERLIAYFFERKDVFPLELESVTADYL
ncbi:MAG: CHAD domain-containing protein [Chloroflexota bacterium]